MIQIHHRLTLAGNTYAASCLNSTLSEDCFLLKWIFILTGAFSVFSGFLTFWLPLPIGLPLILLGSTLLVRHSPLARDLAWSLSARIPGLRKILKNLPPST